MVMLFCALESFVRDRSLECANAIDQTIVPYSHLPIGLKLASLVSTFEGLLNHAKSFAEPERVLEFENASAAAASGSLGSAYKFTQYSFARDKANVSVEDIGSIAKSFGVEKFWSASRDIAARAGMSIPGNLDEVFRRLAKERNRAAHVASYNVQHSQLSSALPEATIIGLAFDTLVSTAATRLNSSRIATGIPPLPVTASEVKFITVKPHTAGKWAAFRPGRTRATFVVADRGSAMARATTEARPDGLSVVCTDSSGRVSGWVTVLG